MEQGLFPLIRETTLHSQEKTMEEERRLCYVGITRAKRKLYLSIAGFRRRWDGANITVPSCFLSDIPENLLEVETVNYYGNGIGMKVTNNHSNSFAGTNRIAKKKPEPDYYDYDEDDASVDNILRVGMVVSHIKFGIGKIVDKEGSGENMMLTIQFKTSTKKIMPKYAVLEVLGT
jgi:DNA helicase-2/ATP-dependent DNA helicase PcrA